MRDLCDRQTYFASRTPRRQRRNSKHSLSLKPFQSSRFVACALVDGFPHVCWLWFIVFIALLSSLGKLSGFWFTEFWTEGTVWIPKDLRLLSLCAVQWRGFFPPLGALKAHVRSSQGDGERSSSPAFPVETEIEVLGETRGYHLAQNDHTFDVVQI